MSSTSKKDIVFEEKVEPTIYKLLDDFSKEVNRKLRQRGVCRGLVSVWSELNGDCLKTQKNITKAYNTQDLSEKGKWLDASYLNVEDLCVDVRFLYMNGCISPGEIGILTKKAEEIKKQLLSWIKSTKNKATEG